MKNFARRFGLIMLMAATFTVASHIYSHCTVASAGSFVSCSLCNAIQGTSVNAAPPVSPEIVLLCTVVISEVTPLSFEAAQSEISRAPPGAVFS